MQFWAFGSVFNNLLNKVNKKKGKVLRESIKPVRQRSHRTGLLLETVYLSYHLYKTKARKSRFFIRSSIFRNEYLANNADSNLFGVSAIEELKLNAPFAELHAVQALLEKYRLLEKAEAHPFSLSGGQKQRLTLAAAEMLDREVFILDEPTSGLDAANMRIIAKRTAQLKQRGKIVIIISHDYEFLLASCDTILAMNKTGFTALCPKHDKEKILERMRGETAAN